MNTKRQTIWLVSMLSLMVVLSAYYLFTEDVNKLDFAAESTVTDPSAKEIVVNTNDLNGKQPAADAKSGAQTDVKTDAAAPAGKQQTTDSTKTDAKASGAKAETSTDAKTNADTGAKQDAKADPQATSKANEEQVSAADAKVLQQVQTQAKSGTDYFISLGLKRDEDLAKQSEKWVTILSDTKQTAEAAANAATELKKIEENSAKVSDLEESLMKDFPQAVITEEGSKWKVTVQSTKLEKSQAVSIVDKVMQEMNVGPDKVVVQYIP
ncbi:SpoIIIAH-like family protein [Paenibacillus doosanensis]|uniref:Stage III sporulation protein AH n=1 Tax=Paenibacillus konkukensis TaxID=2020716 RepID=A0ABY4RIQ4_9BACL|nr:MULTISPECIES: SpoIIIAH-like family protein [Paenibacillus]MCS7461642.1 SpoIIIAH-like family protein [Paenibacillus doosanensis]UQZ82067.1 Stage III sporulation protein AH [Paenibacillus konkukensis]